MEALVNNFIKATGWSIFHSIWQGAIIYGVLLLVVFGFPKINAKIKHNLAYAAMCLMFAGFSITFFSIFELPVASQPADFKAWSSGIAYATYLAALPEEINNTTENLFPYLVSIYGVGLLVQIIVLLSGYQRLLQLKHANRFAVPMEWQKAFETTKAALALKKKIGFYISSNVNVPLVIGYFKPVVLFPVALATQLDIKQVEAILIHELSHIRRNDYLFNLFKTVMETILFFNPFIWLSGRFINIEREHACDDLVLKITGSPLTYAHALLKLELLKSKDKPSLSLAATGKTQHLYQRIKRITDMKTTYMNAKQQLFAISLTLATVISLAWVSPCKSESADKESKPSVAAEGQAKATIFKKISINDILHVKLVQDTSKKKKKIQIVTVDADGKRTEYNSVKEMPDSLRRQVLKDSFSNSAFPNFIDSLTFKKGDHAFLSGIRTHVTSPEFKKHMEEMKLHAKEMSLKFNSPEFKAQMEEVRKNSEELSKKFNSEEFRAQMAEVKKNSEELRKKFESPEWKKQMAEIQKNGEDLRKKFESPEWKKHLQDMKELQNSPEYKELKEKYEKEVDELKKKKGIKTEVGSIYFDFNNSISIPMPAKISLSALAPKAPALSLKARPASLSINGLSEADLK